MTVELNMACLAEATTIHEGLLNVLGAGVTVVSSPGYPTPLPLALVIQGHTDGAAEAQLMCLLIRDDDLRHIFSAEIGIGLGRPLPDGPIWASFSLNVPLATLIPSSGGYTISVTLDEQPPLRMHFLAMEALPSEPEPARASTGSQPAGEELDLGPATGSGPPDSVGIHVRQPPANPPTAPIQEGPPESGHPS